MTRSKNGSGAARRRMTQVAAILIALALMFIGLVTIPASSAHADTRADAVQRRDESQAKANEAREHLEGIDQELAGLFAEMEQTKADVASTEIELADAEAELAAAERHLETVKAQLAEAEAELEALNTAVDTSRSKEGQLNQAVGDMARDLYRGNTTSPLQVVLSADGTSEINSRAAAASALGRVQSKALDEVRSSLVVQENQVEKQTAVTDRITALKVEAEEAYQVAEEARAVVADHLADLQAKQAEQAAAEAAWNARKSEAEAQIKAHDSAAASAAADIAAIDRENTANQVVIPNSSGSSGGAPASSGALFGQPFSFQAPVTSPMGWRVHPIFGDLRLHTGTDFGAACGTPQYATRAGVVVRTGYNSGLGNFVTINHGMINGSSWITEHGHLQSAAVSAGQPVTTSTVVGYTGSTGNSTGCHLHLNLYLNGQYVDITNYM